jgi:hypothetical protein
MSPNDGFSCTDLAWKHGVPLVGTATRGDTWFLIEYPGRWEAKAFEESSIPAAVKAYMAAITPQGRTVRTLLIRQPNSSHLPGFRFFVGQTDPLAPRLYEYYLAQYEDLLALNLASLAAGDAGDPARLRTDPLYLVCTNGRRDRCCAHYGPEVYQAVAAVAGDAVWQSSHIGGHNQAPISLFFPHGVNYGHTTPSEASRLVQAYRQNQVVLHHYRGRVCYPTHVQAAEHFWREQTGVFDLPGLQVEAVEDQGPVRWVVTIRGIAGGQTMSIHLESRESDYEIPLSCLGSKKARVLSYHRVG